MHRTPLCSLRKLTSLILFIGLAASPAYAAPPESIKPSQAANAEGSQATRQIKLQTDVQAKLWAAEPLLENPVAFSFDEKGRMFVAEGVRIGSAVLDNRSANSWPSAAFRSKASPQRLAQIDDEIIDAELAARTVAERERLVLTYFEGDLDRFSKDSDIVKRLVDVDGDGVADQSTLFAGGFNQPMDGLMSGVLARQGQVWITNIPNVWRVSDSDNDGAADKREIMSTGYGVRYAFMGHDMHGLRLGPDGRMYFSIGDRGASVKTREGKVLSLPDRGAVFRCELDGSRLEVFAEGLRNPQELAFDQFGNLFTGDNNSDGGDKARFIHLVLGADYGWRVGFQYRNRPVQRGPWNAEKMWAPQFTGQAAYILPPVDNISSGPSGLTYHPGSAQLQNYRNHFFLADFRGQPSSSGVHSFRVEPRGVSFKLVDRKQFAWGVLATDVDFGPDGALYVSDWVMGWAGTGKGRIHRVFDSKPTVPSNGESVQAILAGDWRDRSPDSLGALLSHPDVRVRMEAQFELVRTGRSDLLMQASGPGKPLLAQLHGIWGLGQILRGAPGANANESHDVQTALVARLQAKPGADDEARAQAAKVLGDHKSADFVSALTQALSDENKRVRFFAAQSLARLGVAAPDTTAAAIAMIEQNADRDPFVRHAGIQVLTAGASVDALAQLAQHPSVSVRLAAVVALRRRESGLLSAFLQDKDLLVVREAARAINDVPIEEATSTLAELGKDPRLLKDNAIAARVIHANFRQGTTAAAELLATIATDSGVDAKLRREAVTALGSWASPQPRDRVTGNHRPLLSKQLRDSAVAASALTRVLDKLLMPKQPVVFVAAAATAAQMQLHNATPALAQAVINRWDGPEVRMAALKALSDFEAPELAQVLPVAAKDPSPQVRLWGLKAQVKAEPARAVSLIDETLRSGDIVEKQAAVGLLVGLQDPKASQRLSALLDDLLSNKLPQPLILDVLEAAKLKGSATLEAKIAQYEKARPQTDLGPFVEAVGGGDPELGERVFTFHAQVQCRRCHSVEGHGAEVGPELSGVGRRRSREYLLEAVVYPSKHFAKGFESVLVTMKTGSIHAGTVKRETTKALMLDSVEEGPLSLEKKEIAGREPGASGMPDGFGSILTKRELRDLVAYLSSLKK